MGWDSAVPSHSSSHLCCSGLDSTHLPGVTVTVLSCKGDRGVTQLVGSFLTSQGRGTGYLLGCIMWHSVHEHLYGHRPMFMLLFSFGSTLCPWRSGGPFHVCTQKRNPAIFPLSIHMFCHYIREAVSEWNKEWFLKTLVFLCSTKIVWNKTP